MSNERCSIVGVVVAVKGMKKHSPGDDVVDSDGQTEGALSNSKPATYAGYISVHIINIYTSTTRLVMYTVASRLEELMNVWLC